MKTTVKIQCPCTGPSAQFQDKQYGQNTRIANVTAKGDKDYRDARCTVCGKVHTRVKVN